MSIGKPFFDNRKVFVEDSLADIVPWFLENRNDDLKKLKEFLESSDYQQIQRMGHRWKGTCASYGFEKLSRAGEAMEELSLKKSQSEILDLLSHVHEYLSQLEIVFVSSDDSEMTEAPTAANRDLQP